ncbi:MAG: SAM-dependent methyltransferase [Rhodospirillaceae bacterium]|nr:MAG: SAM-dependent methyltransferase [Rhodospirillaceae bacterium]
MTSKPDFLHTTKRTLNHYNRTAEGFREGTWDHDVTQNYQALLDALEGDHRHVVLDFGCGPGRDLVYFKTQGIEAVGLDGSKEFVDMARAETDCEVLHQNFLKLDLGENRFDGIFANATLFHVPAAELPRILGELYDSLKKGGVLFSSNPRGDNQEGFQGERYCCYHDLETWRRYVQAVGFEELHHYFRPPGLPRAQQPWLATVWRKPK